MVVKILIAVDNDSLNAKNKNKFLSDNYDKIKLGPIFVKNKYCMT